MRRFPRQKEKPAFFGAALSSPCQKEKTTFLETTSFFGATSTLSRKEGGLTSCCTASFLPFSPREGEAAYLSPCRDQQQRGSARRSIVSRLDRRAKRRSLSLHGSRADVCHLIESPKTERRSVLPFPTACSLSSTSANGTGYLYGRSSLPLFKETAATLTKQTLRT